MSGDIFNCHSEGWLCPRGRITTNEQARGRQVTQDGPQASVVLRAEGQSRLTMWSSRTFVGTETEVTSIVEDAQARRHTSICS